MANNRIYLKCKKCGDTLFLGNTFGTGYFWSNYGKEWRGLGTLLNEFYDRHDYCGENCFEIEYESEVEPVKKDRDCDKCIWSTRSGGCSSWDCVFVDKHEAFEAWKKEKTDESKRHDLPL